MGLILASSKLVDIASQVARAAGPGEIVSPFLSAEPVFTIDAPDGYTWDFAITLQQDGWAFAGDKAFDYWMDVSLDGQKWESFCSGDVWDVLVPARGKKPAGQFTMLCGPLPAMKSLTRKVRFRWDLAKPMKIVGLIELVPMPIPVRAKA